jgi:hypothetical protein
MFIRSKIMGNREDYEKKPEVITAIGKKKRGDRHEKRQKDSFAPLIWLKDKNGKKKYQLQIVPRCDILDGVNDHENEETACRSIGFQRYGDR